MAQLLASIKVTQRPEPDNDPIGDMCDDLLEVHRRLVDELVNQYGGDVGNKTLFLTAAILMLVDRMPVGVEKSLDEIGYSLKELAIRSNLPPTQVTADDAPA